MRKLAVMLVVLVLSLLIVQRSFAEDKSRSAEESKRSHWLQRNSYQRMRTQDFDWNYLIVDGEPAKTIKPVLVMLHGGGTWSYSFRDFVEDLKNEYRVVLVDVPGFGISAPVSSDFQNYGTDSFKKNFLQLLELLGLSRVTLVGHSWGGGLALAFAISYPQHVSKMVLMASSGLDVPEIWQWELFRMRGIGQLATYFMFRATIRENLKQAFFDPNQVTEDMVTEVQWPLLQRFTKRALYYYSRNFNWADIEKELGRIEIPTLILWGREDQYAHVSQAYGLNSKILHSQLKIYDSCGHMLHEECAERIIPDIKAFLQSN